MDQRRVTIHLVNHAWEIVFTLTCHPDTRFKGTFEIVSPGRTTIRAQVIPKSIVTRSDGFFSVRLLAENRDKDANLRNLRALPNASDIQVVRG